MCVECGQTICGVYRVCGGQNFGFLEKINFFGAG
jgi:hypothetical protein